MKSAEIGVLIARRRKNLQITQAYLAQLSGISVHALVNLESGMGNPTMRSLLAVCGVLGLDMNLSVRDVLTERAGGQ